MLFLYISITDCTIRCVFTAQIAGIEVTEQSTFRAANRNWRFDTSTHINPIILYADSSTYEVSKMAHLPAA